MSSDELILRAKKSRPQKKSMSPFSRSAYVARRRGVAKQPLPMSSLAKTTPASVTQTSLKTSNNDACSSPSNTESGKENDVNFASTETSKKGASAVVKKDQAMTTATVLSSTSMFKRSTEKGSSSRKTGATSPASASARKSEPAVMALHPEVSSAIFVRDEFDSSGEDVLNFGKGKRKRFLNVRMFPIGEAMSQKMFEVTGKKPAEKTSPVKKPKLEIDDMNCKTDLPSETEGPLDSESMDLTVMSSPEPVVSKRRKSVDKSAVSNGGKDHPVDVDAKPVPKRRSMSECRPPATSKVVEKRRSSVVEKSSKKTSAIDLQETKQFN